MAASWQSIAERDGSDQADALLQVAGQAVLDGSSGLPNIARVRAVTAWLERQRPRLATEGSVHEWIVAEALELRRSLGDQV